jgi:hypothetical protein
MKANMVSALKALTAGDVTNLTDGFRLSRCFVTLSGNQKSYCHRNPGFGYHAMKSTGSQCHRPNSLNGFQSNSFGVERQASGRRPQGAAALAASPSGEWYRFRFRDSPLGGRNRNRYHSHLSVVPGRQQHPTSLSCCPVVTHVSTKSRRTVFGFCAKSRFVSRAPSERAIARKQRGLASD